MESVLKPLAEIYPQLYLTPGEEGAGLYRQVVGRGEDTPKHSLDHFRGSRLDSVTTETTPAGEVQIVTLGDRQDFEMFLQIMGNRCMPEEIPATQGASILDGVINWPKIRKHEEEYRDALIVLSTGPYSAVRAEDIPLDVIYEDEHVLALNKPPGLVVHPAPGHLTGTLVNALLAHCPELGGIGGVSRPGIVHRLDQDTSGVMVVAKTQRAMDVLSKEFSSHANIVKTYLALVHGTPVPAEGRIENLIGRSPFDRKKMAIVDRNGKVAVTNYRVAASARAVSRVECVIETGRTHQIRVHMASLGTPVVGDAVYGRPRLDRQLDPPPARQLLHAWRLALKHPVTRDPMVFEAPLPEDFAAPWAPPA